MTTLELAAPRSSLVRRSQWLNVFTIAWNALEGVVAVVAGLAAGSASLVGFGIDSGIEVSAALVLAWRLAHERHDGCQQQADRRAQRAIALSFLALSAYVLAAASLDLRSGQGPEESWPGIALAIASLVVMPVLARKKRRLSAALGSRAVEAEANQTDLCTMLSAAVLLGLGANSVFGWWWADAVAAAAIGAAAAWMAVQTWRADSLADTCCG